MRRNQRTDRRWCPSDGCRGPAAPWTCPERLPQHGAPSALNRRAASQKFPGQQKTQEPAIERIASPRPPIDQRKFTFVTMGTTGTGVRARCEEILRDAGISCPAFRDDEHQKMLDI